VETKDAKRSQQGKKGNMCESCVTTFDTKEQLKEHKEGHKEASREATENEKWALSVMLQQEGIMDPCPLHLMDTYRINSTRTASQIEQEDSRVVANFVQHLQCCQVGPLYQTLV
jgi:glutamate/tyrosine decarboxylase-like PLP-dependent enzyme